MKHNSSVLKIIEGAEKQGVFVDQTQKKQILSYAEMVLEWNGKINLVSRANTGEALRQNMASSFLFNLAVRSWVGETNLRFADLGSGGGFPGVLLSVLLPTFDATLIDSSRKKALFLRKVVSRLGLNADVWNRRVESISLSENEKYDFIVALAFAPLGKTLLYAKPLLKRDGFVLALKGKNYREELPEVLTDKIKITPYVIDDEWYKEIPQFRDKTMLKVEL